MAKIHRPTTYVRRLSSGRWEARPYHKGARHTLGYFDTRSQAEAEVAKFFYAKGQAKEASKAKA